MITDPQADADMRRNTARTTLYLARHCDVHNPDGVLYGHLPNFRLSKKGVQQAHAMGRFLRERDVHRIITSPLQRARETSEIVASHLEQPEISQSVDLIEARFGKYLQGVRPTHVPWRRPLWLIHMAWPGLLPSDETVRAMAARVRRPLLQLLREHPGEPGVCISHGDPIQAFWVEAERRRSYALHRLQCAKGGLLELTYDGERLSAIAYRSPTAIGSSRSEPALAGSSHA